MDVRTLLSATIGDIAPLLERREISAAALLDAQLERVIALDGRLQSFLHVTADLAREQAREADAEMAAGRYRGPLHGVPIGIKDLVDTAGIPTTCASLLLRDNRPLHDAAIVDRLEAAGAICVGKLNMSEFAFYGYHPDYTPPRNPWQTDYWAGVSSSGSGVAVAAALCFGAIGTDTGGSIRSPSAACGIVGLKPTFGKISRHGVFPLADTLDHVGPMARSVADCALMLAVLEGRDERDAATRSDPVVDYLAAIADGARGLRVGIDRRYCSEGADPAQVDATARACFMLKGQGVEIVDIDLTGITQAGEHWLAICAVDALLHHRRWFPARADAYGPAFRALLEHGTAVSAGDYARAQCARQAVTALIERELHGVDCILCPAAPRPAMPQAACPPQQVAPPASVPALVRFSAPTNLSGHPSLTLPNGFDAAGLPTSMQFIGRLGDEATVLRIGATYERATGWHRRRPPLD